jgi:hypothetical protein
MTQDVRTNGETPERRRLAQRMEELALALFLVMTGTLWLAPAAWVPEGAWLAGVGLILLGLNGARRMNGLRLSGFGIVAGAAALLAGSGRILGFEHLFVPILLIGLGTVMIGRALVGKKDHSTASGGTCC